MKRLALILVALLTLPAAADIIHLKDGTRIEGDLKRTDGGYIVTDAKGKSALYREDQVVSIELVAPKATSADAANQSLASLRRAMANVTDIKLVLQRYDEFLARHGDTPAADEARKDIQIWKDRQETGLVKYGDQWITVAQRGELLGDAIAQLDKGRQLIKEGRLRDADAIVQKVLELDGRNATALYLRGVLLYRQDQLGLARKAFETVNTLIPNHAPTLNNLAVIVWRQNQFIAALNYYDQALNASAVNKDILNNVAEALQALPKEQRDNVVAKRLGRRFQEQDAQLQDQMSKSGLYRWGATWVNQKQLDELKKAEAEVKGKLDAMSSDFDATQQRITQIDADIQANQRYMQQVDLTNYGTDPATGRTYRLPYPQAYYDVQRDIDRLKANRDEMVRKLDQLRAAAKQVQQRLPTPRYTGLHQLIGPEGAPIKLADPPKPLPATAPAASLRPIEPPRPVSPPPPAQELIAGPQMPATQPDK